MPPIEAVLKRFETPDEIRTFEKGKFEVIHLAGLTIGRATYEPGWKWSVHVGPALGSARCNVEHVGIVLSGCATAAMEDGIIHELCPGIVFYIPLALPVTIAGLSAMSRTCLYISSARITTRPSRLDQTYRGLAGPHGLVVQSLSPRLRLLTSFVSVANPDWNAGIRHRRHWISRFPRCASPLRKGRHAALAGARHQQPEKSPRPAC
jgi:hypothetical protein